MSMYTYFQREAKDLHSLGSCLKEREIEKTNKLFFVIFIFLQGQNVFSPATVKQSVGLPVSTLHGSSSINYYSISNLLPPYNTFKNKL